MNRQKHMSRILRLIKGKKIVQKSQKRRNSMEFGELPPKDPMIQCHAQNWAGVKTLE